MSSRRAWLCGALALAGCGRAARERGVVRLGMVADLGGLGDHSYNDSAWAGMIDARDRLGARISILQSTTAANYQPSMMVFASDGFDAVFCIGYDEAYDLAEVAARFPASRFAIIDAKTRTSSTRSAASTATKALSRLKRIDVSVFGLARLTVTHKAPPRRLSLGLREGGVGLTEFRYTRHVVTPAIAARLDRLTADIVRGTIVVPKTREQLAGFV